MSGLGRLHYHVADDGELPDQTTSRGPQTFRGELPADIGGMADDSFSSDEAAARFYLDALLADEESSRMRGIRAPDRSETVPGLELLDAQDLPATSTKLVRFTQSHQKIPVFGALAVVELTEDRALVSADCRLDAVEEVNPYPTLSPSDALEKVAELTGVELSVDSIPPPQLVFYEDDERKWHLAWQLSQVPAAPPDVATGPGHGLGPSPRDLASVDYLIDAHYGDPLFYFSAAPTLDAGDVPVKCRGIGEDSLEHEFLGRLEDEDFQMHDPLARAITFDLGYADFRPAKPPQPITPALVTQSTNDWGAENKAAVSAHVHARLVHDFYQGIPLKRNGIDDRGMDLVSIVNCTWAPPAGSREWRNACWHQGKMWYGQTPEDQSSTLVSMSRHLDIIGHELTHGVIEHSSNLTYRDEPGALNESFCDIFGIFVKNKHGAADWSDVTTWDWELGAGLGDDGKPLRDLSDPARTDNPDNYSDRYRGVGDYGGVHLNSGIHNKAAYDILTAVDSSGQRVFAVDDAVLLLYYAMVRVPPLATFAHARVAVTDVAKALWAGDPEVREAKVAAINQAYDAVGIP